MEYVICFINSRNSFCLCGKFTCVTWAVVLSKKDSKLFLHCKLWCIFIDLGSTPYISISPVVSPLLLIERVFPSKRTNKMFSFVWQSRSNIEHMIYKSRWYFLWIPISIFCIMVLDGIAKLHSLVEGPYSPLVDFSVTTCPKWHGPCSTFRHDLPKSTYKIAKNSLNSVSNLMPTVELHVAQAPLYKLLFHAKLLVGNAPDEMALTRLTNKSICCTSCKADMNPSNHGFNAIFQNLLAFNETHIYT